MPAKDRYHDTVVRALIKDGWTIADEQVRVEVARRRLLIDLQAERDEENLVILVEIKVFENVRSPMNYLANMIGQYALYRSALNIKGITAPLFLAIPSEAFANVLNEPIAQQVLIDEKVRIIVYEISTEEIIRWISY